MWFGKSLPGFRFNPLTFQQAPNFPRNRRPHFAQYTGERPEMISYGERSKTAKNKSKKKIK